MSWIVTVLQAQVTGKNANCIFKRQGWNVSLKKSETHILNAEIIHWQMYKQQWIGQKLNCAYNTFNSLPTDVTFNYHFTESKRERGKERRNYSSSGTTKDTSAARLSWSMQGNNFQSFDQIEFYSYTVQNVVRFGGSVQPSCGATSTPVPSSRVPNIHAPWKMETIQPTMPDDGW